MKDDILNLALDLSNMTAEKIHDIDKIMLKTQMLSMNARLEAARAGDAGRGFAVVAREMGQVADQVNLLSHELNKAIGDNAQRIEAAGQQMLATFSGQRFADLSRNVVEIIDRNLYERSCDVRWWATDSAVVEAVQDGSPDALAYATSRLATILRSYTVYLDLWVADRSGRIVANGRPDRYPGIAGQNVSAADWFRKGMATPDGDSFAVCDIESNALLGGAQVATYSTAIRRNGDVNGPALGTLGIFFDWAPQAAAIVEGVALSERERATTTVMLLNAKRRIIASSSERRAYGDIFPLEATSEQGFYEQKGALISYALTPGYETYEGLGWYGCIETRAG